MAKQRTDDPVAGFFAKAAQAVAEATHGAIPDIRQKLVEEAWFGRSVTQSEQDVSARLGWTQPAATAPEHAWDDLRKRLAQERGHQPEREVEHGHDFEDGRG
jgi:hypothetical protein